jgi:hypothetical protein
MASLLLPALFVVSMTNFPRSAWDRFDEMLHGDQYVRPIFNLERYASTIGKTFKVGGLEHGAERAGLRKARTGDHLLLHVKRAGAAGSIEEDISVPLRRFTYMGYTPGSAAYVVTILFRILTPLFCLRARILGSGGSRGRSGGVGPACPHAKRV